MSATKTDQKALTPRSADQAKWYTEVVLRSKMADYSPVRGCMVIRPYGYAMWERIQHILGKAITDAGVQNAYFPVFIPYSFLQKEAEHVEGFAPEVAMVTHAGDKELEEKLVVRPTSETIIYHMFSQWLESYRDLPIKINQWANIVRWEKRTTPFLRTTEFLWQEGHTIHANKEEAAIEVTRALDMYHDFTRDYLAMYTIKGYKTEAEKFPGAEYTTTIEGLMRDKKALQSGTSHLLSQGFAKSFDVKFVAEDGSEQIVWPTSWGLSTRVIGGMILMHGDDKGLVLPPNIAPIQVVIVPIFKSDNQDAVMSAANSLQASLKEIGIRCEIDNSNQTPGFKFADAELRGIPIRVELGQKDLEAKVFTCVTRLTGTKEQIPAELFVKELSGRLEQIQEAMLQASKEFTIANTHQVSSSDEFYSLTKQEDAVGYVSAFFCGDPELEAKIKEDTKYSTRCIPMETMDKQGDCVFTGKPGKLTLFAKAY